MRVRVQAKERRTFTRAALRELRLNGRVPAVVYGKMRTPIPISVSVRDLHQQSFRGRAELIDLEVAGAGTFPVMVSQLQRHPVNGDWLHIDFHQVKLDEPVKAHVPLELHGTAKGTKEGGMLQVLAVHVELEALPERMPAVVPVDVSELAVGDKLSVADLTLPEGVVSLSPADELLVTVSVLRGGTTDGESQPAESSAAEAEAHQAV